MRRILRSKADGDLYRAIDSNGDTIDFYLSPTRHMKSAKRFLGKTLARLGSKNYHEVINTDKAGCYKGAITGLKKENKLPEYTVHR